jgi:hypothetical protein
LDNLNEIERNNASNKTLISQNQDLSKAKSQRLDKKKIQKAHNRIKKQNEKAGRFFLPAFIAYLFFNQGITLI